MRQEREWNNLPQWLPTRIADAGYTVERFAWKTKLSRISLYYYMNGKHKPSTNAMARICRVLEVPLEEGLRQYSPYRNGRRPGSGGGTREVTVRQR